MDIEAKRIEFEQIPRVKKNFLPYVEFNGKDYRSKSDKDLSKSNWINGAWWGWLAEANQIKPEWNDYTVKGPRIDGRYQIFISGEQLTAEYKHPFGFTCPIDGCAFVQELITHWALLPEAPVAQEQSHD